MTRDLLSATIELFGLNPAFDRYTRDLMKRGKDAAMCMDVPKVAAFYGLTETETREHRDLQFVPLPKGVQVWPEPKETDR